MNPAKEKNNKTLKEDLAYYLQLMGVKFFQHCAENLIKYDLGENIKQLNDLSEKFFESFTTTQNNFKDESNYKFFKKEVLDKFDPKQYEIFKEKIIDFILSPDITEDEIKYALNQLVDECVNHNEEIIDKLSETFFDWE
ncbi:hypothetical protein AYWB_147 [Aster yellows witches'-broom phytoplasma AYWB]|uniref:Uncharacterized protein n=1 Tax=Aster yellows witches'-broom phytoplasma (strain AYWB) TaxID=322098 RepID=Q2NJX9_AYWBP|nr:hypothetical protein [Aster yellows witches'-broom phytoplasma]ABC65264.1 hypothetical protein AYWB_147 [Aster yellows witches'-broom phytoplasma AYWB]